MAFDFVWEPLFVHLGKSLIILALLEDWESFEDWWWSSSSLEFNIFRYFGQSHSNRHRLDKVSNNQKNGFFPQKNQLSST